MSNTTKVYSKAMEKQFFLLRPCAVVATAVAFQEKGNFSWPFLGFHVYFKIPIASLALGKTRFTMASAFCCICRDNYLQKTQFSWRCRGF